MAGAVESLVEVHFPAAGLDRSAAFGRQPVRDLGSGDYSQTCPTGLNVRGYEPGTLRRRGGSRPGLAKYLPAAAVSGWVIQELNVLVGSGYSPPGGGVQTSQSGRVVTVVAVSQGNVYVAQAGDTAWTTAVNQTGDTPPLNFTGVVHSAANVQKLWFADAVNWVYYKPATNEVLRWAASAGTLPVDSDNNTPRLITTWRGRTVLSGLLGDPQNWFMSKVGDPTDFDYAPVSATPTQAVAGNNAPQGLVGDVLTSLCPYSDDVLIFFGDHTIYMLRGDPMAGGQIDLVSDAIGGVFGICWAKDPYGNVYFVSNRTGIYTMVPGQQPVRLSQPIEQLLVDLDTGANGFRLAWDDRYQGLHVFITPLAAPAATTHLFWEQRSGAWWQDEFASTNFDPLAVCTFDGNDPGDRAVLLGSWDGYVRTVSPTATKDDGKAFLSEVVLGPILTPDLDDVLLKDLQGVLGDASGAVTYEVFVGSSPEAALAAGAVFSGTWTAGRNSSNLIRRSGHAVYVKLSSTNAWALEVIRARVAAQGKVRRRWKE